MRKIEFFYPSFTKKAITFTIDDGNMTYDKKMLDILKPAGIKGTFNLCSDFHVGKEDEVRKFYKGYEISNHCKYHPLVNFDGVRLVISSDLFDPERADRNMIYKVDGKEGFFWIMRPNGWREMVFEKDFIRYADDGLTELNTIFGEGTVKDFVWPYGEQDNAAVKAHVRKTHRAVRKTGCTRNLDGFAIPKDKKAWSYNADHTNILEIMDEYEKYPDDGDLKFFAFGVHSIDFERGNRWGDLVAFADRYGNRPDTYWYASVGEIFDYEEATKLLYVSDKLIKNQSTTTLYVSVDGYRYVIEAGKSVRV